MHGLLNTILTTIQGNTTTLAGILDEQKRLSDSIIELQQKSFTIEGSVYKVCIVYIVEYIYMYKWNPLFGSGGFTEGNWHHFW